MLRGMSNSQRVDGHNESKLRYIARYIDSLKDDMKQNVKNLEINLYRQSPDASNVACWKERDENEASRLVMTYCRFR